MDLIHNRIFRISAGPDAGLYRVILVELSIDQLIAVCLDSPDSPTIGRGGRKKLEITKRPRKKPAPPLVGALVWMKYAALRRLKGALHLHVIDSEEREVITGGLSKADEELYAIRKVAMKGFLNLDTLREQILVHRGLAGLIHQGSEDSGLSKSVMYKLFSLLCRLGFDEMNLRPRRDRCGAANVPRPCDPGGRIKSGRKTTRQRIARAFGSVLAPDQPGMSTTWRTLIMAADKGIPEPKPDMPDRCRQIIESGFVTRYRHEDGKLVAVDPKLGDYPNRRQITRVLQCEIPRLLRILERTTKGHFNRGMRGLIARNWKGVAGPGHTWAIDSTIGDIYLRSAVNRAWIIGRPVVYIIVDVWSTAIVGFYVCLTGPSWDMAKLSLFCSAADPALVGELWGYQPILSLNPSPTMCVVLMCDRGEYLSSGASVTGIQLIPCMSYAPPYRPDLKGLVEVLHRIEKDRQYLFVPGAIDQRRAEYELRRFNPNEAVLTVHDYVHYLYTIFTEYNLTADRRNRCDAHMIAAGVFPSPAGLWHWGHLAGIGTQRAVSTTTLITNLLPTSVARVARNGVLLGGKHYSSREVEEQQWTTFARNQRGWDIPAYHFPGSVSRIWTPNTAGAGLLDLRLSDQSTASSELTWDEALDAFAYGQLSLPDQEHARILHALKSIRQVKEIVDNAKMLTAEAIGRASGRTPSITEARRFESISDLAAAPDAAAPESRHDAALEAHVEMMQSVLAAANCAGDSHG